MLLPFARRSLLSSVLFLSACGAGTVDLDGELLPEDGSVQQGLVRLDTGRVIVNFKPAASASARAAAHQSAGATVHRTLRGGAQVVKVTSARTAATVQRYRANPNVAWAEEDALVDPDQVTTVTPNDPSFGSQWQHVNIESAGGWAYGTGSSSVRLAICDTGVSTNHPDLAASLRMDLCYNTASNGPGNCDPVGNHGTAVAGSAAALGNNALGVSGVAWSAQIIPVRVSNLFSGSAYISDMAECIRYSADVGAHVINLSYQTYSGGTIYQSLLDAATYAEGKGAVTVMAAGNENTQAVTSQDPAQILYVAATTSTNAKSSFSNFGPYVDLAAPGSSIYTTNVTVACTDSNANSVADPGECVSSGNGYVSISGTSFSSPITAGAAVVLKALRPTATPAEIRNALTAHAVDLGTAGEDVNFGAGLLNLRKAAASFSAPLPNTAPSITLSAPAGGSASISTGSAVTFTASATDAEQGSLSSAIQWTLPGSSTQVGGTALFTFSSAGTFTVTATVTDAGGLSASTQVTVTVTDPAPNTAPSLSLVAPAGGSVTVNTGSAVTFSASASDAEQGDLSAAVKWTVPGGSQQVGASVQYTFNTVGSFTVVGTVTDAGGLSASVQANVTVVAPPPPAVPAAPTALAATVGAGRTVRLAWTDNATNESGYYVDRAKVNNNGTLGAWAAVATLGANTSAFSQSVAKGNYAYRVRAWNAGGAAASNEVRVTVR